MIFPVTDPGLGIACKQFETPVMRAARSISRREGLSYACCSLHGQTCHRYQISDSPLYAPDLASHPLNLLCIPPPTRGYASLATAASQSRAHRQWCDPLAGDQMFTRDCGLLILFQLTQLVDVTFRPKGASVSVTDSPLHKCYPEGKSCRKPCFCASVRLRGKATSKEMRRSPLEPGDFEMGIPSPRTTLTAEGLATPETSTDRERPSNVTTAHAFTKRESTVGVRGAPAWLLFTCSACRCCTLGERWSTS